MNFGAFVEFLPGKEGLVHISKLAWKRVEHVEDVVKEGDIVQVKVVEIDSQGRINLSIRDTQEKPADYQAFEPSSQDRPPRVDRRRGGGRDGRDRPSGGRDSRDRSGGGRGRPVQRDASDDNKPRRERHF